MIAVNNNNNDNNNTNDNNNNDDDFNQVMMMSLEKKAECLTYLSSSEFLLPTDILAIFQLSKATNENLRNNYWFCLCRSFSLTYKIFVPLRDVNNYKDHFFNHVWASRHKWDDLDLKSKSKHQDFNIKVCIRFRPGNSDFASVLLPIHQRLKLVKKGETLTIQEPEEFCCALLHTRMKDPVLLPTSNKVCEKKAIIFQLKRSNKDPFNDENLSEKDLIPCEDLKLRIIDWVQNLRTAIDDKIRMRTDELSGAIEKLGFGQGLDPSIIETLINTQNLKRTAIESEREVRRIKDLEDDEEEENDNNEQREEVINVNSDNESDNDDEINSNNNLEELNDEGFEKVNNKIEEEEEEEERKDENTSKDKRIIVRDSPHVISIENSRCVMFVPGRGICSYVFNRVHDHKADQHVVYHDTAKQAVCSALNGFNAAVLCYGQTGSGKTHTMFGPEGILSDHNVVFNCGENGAINKDAGIVLQTCNDIFDAVNIFENMGISINISMKYLEIYKEKASDLLTGKKVILRSLTKECVITGASEHSISTKDEALSILRRGQKNKSFAETAMNSRSSRAHTIVVFAISQKNEKLDTIINSNLYMVDLAGSERVKKSKVVGSRLEEAIEINSSLMNLGRCVEALSNEQNHIPYNNSKLTVLLKNCFGGNSKSYIIINCQKDKEHGSETFEAIRFGDRCSSIVNQLEFNKKSLESVISEIKDALITCESQIQSLKEREKTHMPAYAKLCDRFLILKHKLNELQTTTTTNV